LDLKDIKELIALMRKNDLSVFKLEREGMKVTLKRGNDFQPVISTTSFTPSAAAATLPSLSSQSAGSSSSATSAANTEKLHEITSPMVGTFYASPSPDAPAYVKQGQEVDENSVVCIVEAMKVMNEIKAECRGTIVEMVAENGKPVQFGQVLYRVRK
jgi:acetyl-CoA carboxylase biotin carboxyl carrier protein